jgi:hypothetical protein
LYEEAVVVVDLIEKNFVLHSEWPPSGDQPEAIEALT